MSRKPYLMSKQLVLATALALGASSVALADDSSMNPFTGDSYKYFNGGNTLGNAARFNRPVFSNVPADPSWRQSHPNGLTERELQALSSSSLAIWQSPTGSGSTVSASTGEANVAQTRSKETFSARLARFFHPESGPQAGSSY
jgi:hypothetical protein